MNTLQTPTGDIIHSARAGRQLHLSLAGDYAFMGQAATEAF